jgi:flagellar FliL protein
MNKSRLLNLSIILLIAVTLLAIVTFFLYKFVLIPEPSSAGSQAPSIEELEKLSVATGDITTNLKDDRYAVMNFTIITDNKKAKQEVEAGMFLVKREIIGILSSLSVEDLTGEEGVVALEARIITRLNSFLQEGEVVKVVTTNRLFQ